MAIRELTLREMLVERIMFAHDTDVLQDMYRVTEDEMQHMTDSDLLDLYEDIVFDNGYTVGMDDANDE